MIATPVANPPMISKFSSKNFFTSLKHPYVYKRIPGNIYLFKINDKNTRKR